MTAGGQAGKKETSEVEVDHLHLGNSLVTGKGRGLYRESRRDKE